MVHENNFYLDILRSWEDGIAVASDLQLDDVDASAVFQVDRYFVGFSFHGRREDTDVGVGTLLIESLKYKITTQRPYAK